MSQHSKKVSFIMVGGHLLMHQKKKSKNLGVVEKKANEIIERRNLIYYSQTSCDCDHKTRKDESITSILERMNKTGHNDNIRKNTIRYLTLYCRHY
jgi:transcriptional regulator